jgi:hypothetical protein
MTVEDLKKKFAEGWPPVLDVGPGWVPLVLECDKELSEIDPDYKIQQIKQKFGGLRYYILNSRTSETSEIDLDDMIDTMAKIISKYETLALETCEVTGAPGRWAQCQDTKWLKTLSQEVIDSDPQYSTYKFK